MIYRKLAFADQSTFYQLMEANGLRAEGAWVGCDVVELGPVCVAQDGEGNCTQTDPRWAVDVIFHESLPQDLEAFVVWPAPIGIHVFAGWEQYYTEAYNARQ